MRRGQAGFTLVEILIVLVVIAVIAMIAIPNLSTGLHRGKQMRSMSDMRTLGAACDAYAIDEGECVRQEAPGPAAGIASWLEPTYVQSAPRLDGWASAFVYEGAEKHYTLTSYGKDRHPGGGGAVSADGSTTDYDNDIVLSAGRFVQYPAGAQR